MGNLKLIEKVVCGVIEGIQKRNTCKVSAYVPTGWLRKKANIFAKRDPRYGDYMTDLLNGVKSPFVKVRYAKKIKGPQTIHNVKVTAGKEQTLISGTVSHSQNGDVAFRASFNNGKDLSASGYVTERFCDDNLPKLSSRLDGNGQMLYSVDGGATGQARFSGTPRLTNPILRGLMCH